MSPNRVLSASSSNKYNMKSQQFEAYSPVKPRAININKTNYQASRNSMNNIMKTANTPSFQRNINFGEATNPLHFTTAGRRNNLIEMEAADDSQAAIWSSPTSPNNRLMTAKSDTGKRGFLANAKIDARYQTRTRQRYPNN